MVSLFSLPQDIWRDRIIPFVAILGDFVRIDSALLNKSDRMTFHNNISGMKHECHINSDKRALTWFNKRYIVVHSIYFGRKKQKKTWIGYLLSSLRNITGRNAAHYSRLLESTIKSQSCMLTNLYLNTDDIQDLNGIRHAKNLTKLHLSHCRKVTSGSFVLAIAECPHLQECSILYCDLLQGAAAAAVLVHCKNLTEFTVSEPSSLDNVFSQVNQPLKLQKFMWHYPSAHITSLTVRAMANLMPQLEHLEWNASRWCTYTTSDTHILIQKCVKLRALVWSGKKLFTDPLLHHIGQSLTLLRYINLSACTEIGDAGVIALAQGCTLLEYLNLSFLSTLTDVAI